MHDRVAVTQFHYNFSLRKQPTFGKATTTFPAKCRRRFDATFDSHHLPSGTLMRESPRLTKKFATVVLGSLPESYDNFLTSLNYRSADDLD